MPVGQPINPAPATGQGTANRPSHGGYNIGQGIGSSPYGTITIPTPPGGFTTVAGSSMTGTLSLDNLAMDISKREVDLPSITFRCEEDGKWFTLTLRPEHTMTPFECLQLMRLINPNTLPRGFDVIGFVRKNNLEKHFKFE